LQRLQARVDHSLGDPENPLSWDALTTQFDGLAAGLLAAQPVSSFTQLLGVAP
jgi:2-methylcitrate dehydratase PrpD